MTTTFAERIKQAMRDANMTQLELSRRTGIGKPSISQYLSGYSKKPNQRYIELMAEALNCTTDYLKGLEPHPVTESPLTRTITIKDAAKCLGKTEQFVRIGIQRGILLFGSAVPGSGTKWWYYINPDKFRDFAGHSRFDYYFGMDGTNGA